VMPKDLASVPIAKIIELRKSHGRELSAFQATVRAFALEAADLKGIEDAEAFRMHLAVRWEKQLRPQLDDLRARLESRGIDTVLGAMSVQVKLPEALASPALLGLGLVTQNPVAMGFGIALSVLPVIRARRKETVDDLKSSPAAYLMRVEEGLRASTLGARIQRKARTFLSGG
jgi:hypothetical protein